MRYMSSEKFTEETKSIIVWLRWLFCVLRLTENRYEMMTLSFFKAPNTQGLTITLII